MKTPSLIVVVTVLAMQDLAHFFKHIIGKVHIVAGRIIIYVVDILLMNNNWGLQIDI